MSDPLNTLDDAIGEINRRFERTLPRLADLDADSFLATLWKLAIVTDDNPPAPMVFKACATDRQFAFAGNLKGQLIIYVTQGPDAAVTPCPPPSADQQGSQ
ncbi:hypothetical protein SAMN05444161_7157 [Rhizobiales bacterium GAS191]|jgi:hypothetical protein|nr:hypothetical protein SAMN05519103_06505 [Rhizobiales bacterium GAS113]SED76246.1 hypothetical protein SAMN05519104_4297 [Rhizobiales bacterium GAS188]SEE78763.1 hypothetical protein SAMN05444161_7157 [Rhizobiales bacterium GAS191]